MRQTGTHRHEHQRREPYSTRWSGLVVGRGPRIIGAVLAGLLLMVLLVTTLELVDKPVRSLAQPAMAHLPESGVENPVTAVLLNYRGYDTWLELGVLLLAMMGALALLRAGNLKAFSASGQPEQAGFLGRLMGLFLPLMVVAAGYLLWRGTHAPGGAFQAGAMAGAAGVMARLAGRDRLHRTPGWLLRPAYAVGFALFMAVGLAMLPQGRSFIEYAVDAAGTWIFVLELFAALSIAVTLWSLYVAAYPDVETDLPAE